MRRTRVGLVVSSCLAGALLVAPDAGAQPKAGQGARSEGQLSLRRNEAGGPEAQAARARARAGDCAAALSGFDAALRTSIDPALRRDRGLCHDKLGHVYPAIDDFRAYLTAQPEAPDAEQIRERLTALEGEAKTVEAAGERPASERDRDRERAGGKGRASATVSVGAEGASASAATEGAAEAGTGTETGASSSGGKKLDTIVDTERRVDAAEDSPLRYGSGVVLGPFFQMPRFWLGEKASSKLAYTAGLTFRYSTGPLLTIISELGAAGIGTSGEASASSGALLMAGLELRLPVSRFAGDHILVRGGAGYEHQVVSGTRAVTDNVLGRFGLGYRHVFGSSLALEALLDGGPAYVIPESGPSRVNAVVGLSIGLLVGF